MERVKLYAAALYSDPALGDAALQSLARTFGGADVEGSAVPFDLTDYYEAEMGKGLLRKFVGFTEPVPPMLMVAAKVSAMDVEKELAVDGRRRVNVDIGYLDGFKVTLASTKARGNKVYLDRDVWLDTQLYFEKGKWHPLPWTFPDFRAGRYDADLLRIRARYREQMRSQPFPWQGLEGELEG